MSCSSYQEASFSQKHKNPESESEETLVVWKRNRVSSISGWS